MRNHEKLFSLFDQMTFGDDSGINYGKPEPDLYIATWKKFDEPLVSQCLVFEDSLNGIQAAIKAKMHVCLSLF